MSWVGKFHCLNQIWPWRSKSIATQNNRDLHQAIFTSGPNLVILAWMGNELWSWQAQNGVNSDFEVKFDLECQGQLPPKTIGTLTKVFCIFGPNLAILAWTGPELSHGQATDWHTDRQTDRHTDAGNDNTRRPKLASGKIVIVVNYTQCWGMNSHGVDLVIMEWCAFGATINQFLDLVKHYCWYRKFTYVVTLSGNNTLDRK